ncbi:plasmalemma vesicle associated protein a [Antennarius striatus]|uniref:plasmalemma vesicle associated protein a n=1 Tax=Antennarius striatus TaxID=241820 RepID=UPI0035B1B2AF
MYSSGYSQVSMRGMQAQKKMQYRSRGKSCGYYMRIVFFFSSLIQSLIIVSLVLFLIYGKKQDSASVSRIQDLEESFSRLSIENMDLKRQRKNLTSLLNTTLIEKARNDWDLAMLRYLSNRSVLIIDDFRNKLRQCNEELFGCRTSRSISCPYTAPGTCNCGLLLEQQKAKLVVVESNFTQTTQRMSREMDGIARERDTLNLQAISLRRDKFTKEKELEFFRQKCKGDFTQSLSGISNVTKAFLEKVDSVFPACIAFQLTCPKQREHLEQIRTNCSSLSRDVEDRFQRYLNSVGEQVSTIQAESSRLKAENWRLSDDYRSCNQNRTGMIQQHKQNLDKLQRKHDGDKEGLLVDKMKLIGEIEVLDNNVKYKSKEVEHLRQQLRQLNMTCMAKTGFVGLPGGSTSRAGTSQTGWGVGGGTGGFNSASSGSSGLGQFGRTGSGSPYGSSGSSFNKVGSTGTGSSSTSLSSSGSNSATGYGLNKIGSTGTGSSSTSLSSSGSSGFGFNKPASTGTGSSSTSLFSSGSGSSTGSGYNKPGSTGGTGSTGSNPSVSSSGTGYNKPGTSSRGSSGLGSSYGSTGSSQSLGSSETGSSKTTTNTKSSSSSSSSSGSSSKSSSGFSWLGFGSSSSGQSKTGSGTGKGTSSGSSSSTGSLFGGGRTNALAGGPVSVAQHLQDLQRLINSRPEERQDLSRVILG